MIACVLFVREVKRKKVSTLGDAVERDRGGSWVYDGEMRRIRDIVELMDASFAYYVVEMMLGLISKRLAASLCISGWPGRPGQDAGSPFIYSRPRISSKNRIS